jgi:hypothetical protein
LIGSPIDGRAGNVTAAYAGAVAVEEHELHYTRDAPLVAWRLFRIRPSEDGVVLSSPMFHDPEHPPWPAVVSEAACFEGHPAPAPSCRCGIYAAVRGTLDSLPGYLLDTAYERDPWTYAEVACFGRVFVDMRGVRAERAASFAWRCLTRDGPDPMPERWLRASCGLDMGYRSTGSGRFRIGR